MDLEPKTSRANIFKNGAQNVRDKLFIYWLYESSGEKVWTKKDDNLKNMEIPSLGMTPPPPLKEIRFSYILQFNALF